VTIIRDLGPGVGTILCVTSKHVNKSTLAEVPSAWRRIGGRIGGPRVAEAPYMAMIRMFGLSGGASNDLLHKIVAVRRPARSISGAGMFGPPSDAGISGAVTQLRRDGFVVFPQLLDPCVCDQLVHIARSLPCDVRLRPNIPPLRVNLLPEDVSVAWLSERDLASDPLIQQIVSDPGFLALAQAYLGCEPILSVLAMWWSRAVHAVDRDRIENAQQFHFDIDRVKWLKFFVYLTDVDSSNGPHVYVAGSHRRGGQPRKFLRRGNTRRDDRAVIDYFGERVIELTGPRGTVFAADTRGLHKGKPPEVGERLVLQLEFADSLIGAAYWRISPVFARDPQLVEAARSMPATFRRWDLTSPLTVAEA
jgi:hypothetical protein